MPYIRLQIAINPDGADYLKVDYIFWSAQEPFYSKQLIPFLKH